MNHSLALAAALAAALTACYVAPDPDGFPGERIARLEVVDAQPVPADGQNIVHLVLDVDPNTPPDTTITVETSSGVLSASADPSSPEARKIGVKNLASGQIPLALRVGITPGITLVTANVGGHVTTKEVDLSPSPPESIVLSAPKTSLPADGESNFDITAQLFAAEAPAKVSVGARVRFAICCADAGGAPVPCSDPDPLAIPGEAQLDSGQSILVEAVTERILAEPGAPSSIPAIVVAQANLGDGSIALCGPAAGDAVRAELAVVVRPIVP